MIYASTECPGCGAAEVLNVAMTVQESALSFAFCTQCEWKGWAREGETLSLTSVLSLVTR